MAFYLRLYEVRVQYHGGVCCLIKVFCRLIGYDIDSAFAFAFAFAFAVDVNKESSTLLKVKVIIFKGVEMITDKIKVVLDEQQEVAGKFRAIKSLLGILLRLDIYLVTCQSK